jgi:uncharacterized membrane protein YdjX (TVP38/TMEM64 family)
MMEESVGARRSLIVYWIFLVGIVLLFALLLHSATFKSLFDQATEWSKVVMNAHPVAGAAVFFLFAAVSAMLAFTSSAVLVAPANLVWGKLITFLLLWGGWLAGAMVAFGIGSVARPLLVRLGYQKRLNEYQQFVSKRMKFWAAVLFCIAVPSEIPGYLFGGLGYPFWKFIGAIAIAEAIYAFGIVIAGQSLLAAKPLKLLLVIATLIIIGVVARWLLRSLRKDVR